MELRFEFRELCLRFFLNVLAFVLTKSRKKRFKNALKVSRFFK